MLLPYNPFNSLIEVCTDYNFSVIENGNSGLCKKLPFAVAPHSVLNSRLVAGSRLSVNQYPLLTRLDQIIPVRLLQLVAVIITWNLCLGGPKSSLYRHIKQQYRFAYKRYS